MSRVLSASGPKGAAASQAFSLIRFNPNAFNFNGPANATVTRSRYGDLTTLIVTEPGGMTRAMTYALLMGAFTFLMQWGVAADTAKTITTEHWTRMLIISSAFTIFSLLIYYSDIFRARLRSLIS